MVLAECSVLFLLVRPVSSVVPLTVSRTTYNIFGQLHGMIGWGALLTAFAGLYCIYQNKELSGKSHVRLHSTLSLSRIPRFHANKTTTKALTHSSLYFRTDLLLLLPYYQLMTPHSWGGVGVMVSSVGLGMAGGTFWFFSFPTMVYL